MYTRHMYTRKPIFQGANLEKRDWARGCVERATVNGELVRPKSCQECWRERMVHAHHEDYLKPLDVKWLCRKCHYKRHYGDNPHKGVLNLRGLDEAFLKRLKMAVIMRETTTKEFVISAIELSLDQEPKS